LLNTDHLREELVEEWTCLLETRVGVDFDESDMEGLIYHEIKAKEFIAEVEGMVENVFD
jgi:hypothetical protein